MTWLFLIIAVPVIVAILAMEKDPYVSAVNLIMINRGICPPDRCDYIRRFRHIILDAKARGDRPEEAYGHVLDAVCDGVKLQQGVREAARWAKR